LALRVVAEIHAVPSPYEGRCVIAKKYRDLVELVIAVCSAESRSYRVGGRHPTRFN